MQKSQQLIYYNCIKKRDPKNGRSKDDLVGNKNAERIMAATSASTCDDPSQLTTPAKLDETSIQ